MSTIYIEPVNDDNFIVESLDTKKHVCKGFGDLTTYVYDLIYGLAKEKAPGEADGAGEGK